MLCATCDSLNIEPSDFFVRLPPNGSIEKDFGQYHHIGTLDEIQRKSPSCDLCHLFIACLGVSKADFDKYDAEQKNTELQVFWQEDGFVYGHPQPYVRCLRILPLIPSRTSVLSYEGSRICLMEDARPAGVKNLFLARNRPQRVNAKLIKKWLKSCLNWHGSICDLPHTSVNGDNQTVENLMKSLRVIDCWDLCLTDVDMSDTDYFALSYVWGTRPVLMLTSANVTDLYQPQALRHALEQIPQTIQDAIHLTSTLGRPYIWVDSLCIQQDHASEKARIISQMDKIYDHAFLTIVALDGDNANAGLTGFKHQLRSIQPTAQLSKGARVTHVLHLSDELADSVYDTRAWTYQERRISRRCLFFGKHSMVFQCDEAVWKDDLRLEQFDIENCIDFTQHMNSGLSSPDKTFSTKYVGSLYEYSQRDLGNELDVINAFSGVLSVTTDSQKCFTVAAAAPPAICGLPLICFDWAMLWKYSGAAKRRHAELPSWSWCAWQSTISTEEAHLEDDGIDAFQRDNTWIRWFMHGSSTVSAQRHTLCLRPPEGITANSLFPPDKFPPLSVHTTTTIASEIARDISVSPIGAVLSFMTLTIDLHLFPIKTDPFSTSYSIGAHQATAFGYIALSNNPRPEQGSKYRFAAISAVSSSARKFSQLKGCGGDPLEAAYHVIMTEIPFHPHQLVERIDIGIISQAAIHGSSLAQWVEVHLK